MVTSVSASPSFDATLSAVTVDRMEDAGSAAHQEKNKEQLGRSAINTWSSLTLSEKVGCDGDVYEDERDLCGHMMLVQKTSHTQSSDRRMRTGTASEIYTWKT